MGLPLQTIPTWVPNSSNPKILFITENYPGKPNANNHNTYFYRALNPNITLQNSNNLLNNLCRSFNIGGINERNKLGVFLNQCNYFLIDTYPSGQAMSRQLIKLTINNIKWIDTVLNDIVYINPQQIIFTCVGSNGLFLRALLNRARQRGVTTLNSIVQTPFGKNKQIFHSPSNRAFPVFNQQIQQAIRNGTLIP